MIDVSYADIVGTAADGPDESAAGSVGSESPGPAARYHHHEWHAWSGDTEWVCSCGASVSELRFGRFVIPLPKAIV